MTVRLDEETSRELAELAGHYPSRSAAIQIAIRLTTTARDLPTWVKLSPADPLTGYANADCIEQLGKDELGGYLGALSPASMRGVDQALAIALALT